MQSGLGSGNSSMGGVGNMGGSMEDQMMLSWQREDLYDLEQVSKPGGYVVKLKDNIPVQAMKNKERNKGTYKIFGGSFDETTTQAAYHNLRSIGQEGFRPCRQV